MMGKHVVVTGANGFVGRALVKRLLQSSQSLVDDSIDRLTLVDLSFDQVASDSRVQRVQGNIADPDILTTALGDGSTDVVFHLASVPGGKAEQDFELGRRVNLDATQHLLDLLARAGRSTPTRLVFASSVAVYGASLPAMVDENTPLQPHITYGAHKLIGEILIQDMTRRGVIDGRILRLPGIVARPLPIHGMLSAFMSEVFWHLRDGHDFECPVSADAVAWWMSVGCCANNLLHAANLSPEALTGRRAFALPVLHLTMREVIDGLCERYGQDRRDLVQYRPDEELEAAFGRFPPLNTPTAQALGFGHDGSVDALIENCLAEG